MTAGAWRIIAPIVSLAVLAVLAVCQAVGGENRGVAARVSEHPAAARDAGPNAAEARPEISAAAAHLATSAEDVRPVIRLSPAECGRLKRRVERELTDAQRCKADRECASIDFEYAFRPCGESARSGAALDRAAADAKAYVDGCQPVLHPVRCAHRTISVCARGRCALTPPPGE